MVLIDRYVRPKSLKEAYELLVNVKGAKIMGGFTFIRLGKIRIPLLIDLQDLNLDFIREYEGFIEIGAMVRLGDLERNDILLKAFDGFLANAVKYIWSVQLRNIATIGGTVFARLGFSDFITSLMVLNTKVVLYKNGEIPLEDFVNSSISHDILISIKLKKESRKASFKFMRNSFYDFSILNVAVSARIVDGKYDNIKITVGARPYVAKLARNAMKYLEENGLNNTSIMEASKIVADEMNFGTNIRADSEYRKMICPILVKRAFYELLR